MIYKTIPYQVREACRERGISKEEQSHMTRRQLFQEYCEWHGLINWSETLWNIVDGLLLAEDAKV